MVLAPKISIDGKVIEWGNFKACVCHFTALRYVILNFGGVCCYCLKKSWITPDVAQSLLLDWSSEITLGGTQGIIWGEYGVNCMQGKHLNLCAMYLSLEIPGR